ncbi:hypothetical protein [Tengunoibacter tsumagoiensis]|uniref:Uncharacterized protein n=1 Tax=Tengunoibacter tsumagoiensis TaxID=2014871 RepID=A0A401ZX73_9CHLR|nr:hypothetical protein [Tengunoibacter tsumagoiensis]GCE11448.1 hypothetical protein KTT_13070 [Tengunoibacter tsumagoiensis]
MPLSAWRKGFSTSKLFFLALLSSGLLLILFPTQTLAASSSAPLLRKPGVRSLVAPRATNIHESIVAVHGLNGGDGPFGSATYGSQTMPGCDTYWADARTFMASQWPGDFRQLSYYNEEVKTDGSGCADNGAEKTYSANLQVQTYRSHCTNFFGGNEGTNNEDINHLSCLLAWYLYYNFGQHGWQVILVGHSMGGLIIQRTLELEQQRNANFPPSIGNVTDAITFNTPHAGVLLAVFSCFACRQGQQMYSNSNLIQDLTANGRHPDAGGTDWTVIGSDCDGLVHSDTAVGMGANHKVIYVNDSGNTACYDHGSALHDFSLQLDGHALYCDTTSPLSSDCDGTSGNHWTSEQTNYPHGLYELYQATASYYW